MSFNKTWFKKNRCAYIYKFTKTNIKQEVVKSSTGFFLLLIWVLCLIFNSHTCYKAFNYSHLRRLRMNTLNLLLSDIINSKKTREINLQTNANVQHAANNFLNWFTNEIALCVVHSRRLGVCFFVLLERIVNFNWWTVLKNQIFTF